MLPAEFFLVTLPDGSQLVHGRENLYAQFDMQFGRRVLAHFTGVAERADWKDCGASELEEAKEAQRLRPLIDRLMAQEAPPAPGGLPHGR